MRDARVAVVTLALLLSAGCAARPDRDRTDVSNALRLRTGHGTPPDPVVGRTSVPDGTNVEDGLSLDEAVAIALWNNPDYQAELADLGFARADLLEAGLLQDPVLSFLFPWGPKQWEATLRWPLEAIWLRPRRVAIGQRNVEKVAERLVHSGLGLALEVKIAFIDLVLAESRNGLLTELASVERELADRTQARLRAGDVSEMESDRARAEALAAEQRARGSSHEVEAGRARLLGLLGFADAGLDFDVVDPDLVDLGAPLALAPIEELMDRALASRPDLRAAELAIEIAGEHSGLARSQYLSIAALIDTNEKGQNGTETGPGVAVTIPVFDRGRGRKARAAAELEQATLRYASVRNRIAVQVREARSRLSGAVEASQHWRDEMVRFRHETVGDTRRALDAGEVSELALLGARRDYLDSLLRQAGLFAEVRQAQARLENAVGAAVDRPRTQLVRSP